MLQLGDYPAGFNGIEGERENTYLFEVSGEIEIEAYSEEDAENVLEDDLKNILFDAYRNGEITIN